MTARRDTGASFHSVLERINAEAGRLPDEQRLGYLKGAINNAPELTDAAERAALFNMVTLAGASAITQTAPAPPSLILNQTIAPTQTQTASPTIVTPQPSSKRSSGSSRSTAIIVAVIGLLGVLGAAWLTGYFSLRAGKEKATPRDSTAGASRPASPSSDLGRPATEPKARLP